MSAKYWLLALAPRPEERAADADLEWSHTAPVVQKPAERTIALRATSETAAHEPDEGVAPGVNQAWPNFPNWRD